MWRKEVRFIKANEEKIDELPPSPLHPHFWLECSRSLGTEKKVRLAYAVMALKKQVGEQGLGGHSALYFSLCGYLFEKLSVDFCSGLLALDLSILLCDTKLRLAASLPCVL